MLKNRSILLAKILVLSIVPFFSLYAHASEQIKFQGLYDCNQPQIQTDVANGADPKLVEEFQNAAKLRIEVAQYRILQAKGNFQLFFTPLWSSQEFSYFADDLGLITPNGPEKRKDIPPNRQHRDGYTESVKSTGDENQLNIFHFVTWQGPVENSQGEFKTLFDVSTEMEFTQNEDILTVKHIIRSTLPKNGADIATTTGQLECKSIKDEQGETK